MREIASKVLLGFSIGFVIFTVVLLYFAHEANAQTALNWSILENGDVVGVQLYTPTYPGPTAGLDQVFLSKTLDFNAPETCGISGGYPGQGNAPYTTEESGVLDYNIFTDGGLDTVGSYDCTEPGTYYWLIFKQGEYLDSYASIEWDGEEFTVPSSDSNASHITNFDVAGYPGNTIALGVSYISNLPIVDRVCINLTDLTVSQTLIPICQTISQSGTFTFSTTTNLIGSSTAPHSYRAMPVLYYGTTTVDYLLGIVFTVGTSTQTYNPETGGWAFGELPPGVSSTSTIGDLTLECDPNDGFFSRSVCNLAVLLFVPSNQSLQQLDANLSQVLTKQPFSAYQEFRAGWNGALQNPNVPSSSLNLEFYGVESEVISTTTFTAIVGSGWLNIRGLIAIGLWIMCAYFMFMKVIKFF